MAKLPRILVVLFFISILLGTLKLNKAYAAALSSVSDTITTSRPSASAPLAANQGTSDTQLTIYDNGSFFLSSDSATLRPDTGETQNTVTVASMSAANTPSSGQRIVYLTGTAANTHHNGDPVTVGITAMHTIQFTNTTAIPSGGKIVITFPGSGVNTASPSASTFSFNSLASSQIKTNNASTCTFTITAPSITCTTNATINAGTVVTFLIGCTAASGASCTTQAPTLINPTKSAAAGTADIWKVTIATQDNSSNPLDSTSASIGTNESVQISATVDPSLTFSLSGINGNTAVNTGNTTGCTNTETTTTGLTTTANSVDLGSLNGSNINIAAQLLSINTNAQNGYVLTATSSGHLINASTGYWLRDTTTPTVMNTGNTGGYTGPFFGIHPCGLDVSSGTWATGATGGGAGAKYAWPTTSAGSISNLASASTGPVGNSILAGNGLVTIEYAATVNVSVPAGTYQSVITYVVTPTF
jgi:hypothetical protein